MKFGFIINVFREDDFHSGGERLFYEYTKNIIDKGHQVDLYCSKYLTTNENPTLKFNKITILGNSKDYKYPKKIEKLFNQFEEEIKQENYDYVISENITPIFDIALLQGHSQAHYLKMSGNIFEKIIYFFKKFQQLKYQKKWLSGDFRKLIVPSNTLKNELIENFKLDENKLLTIYPGIDLPKTLAENKLSDFVNCSKPLVIGLSAPSFAKKGGYVLLNALKILKNKGYDLKAKIIYPKYKKNLIPKLLIYLLGISKNIEFLDYQNDMANFYKNIDCAVMPSIMETFGLVGLEAMSYKNILFAGSYSGISEIINDSENGFVFDMKHNPSKNLAEKIEFLLNNKSKAHTISEAGYFLSCKFTWDRSFEEFYNSL